jgi:hypothetical protein
MERVAERMGASRKWASNDSPALDTEQFKAIADQLIEESGARPYLHTFVVDTILEGDTIIGVIIESKSGRQAIMAKRVIDCTGDADVAFLSMVPCSVLPLEKNLGVTTIFNVSGVKKDQFLEYVRKHPRTYADWSKETWKQQTTGKEDALPTPYLEDELVSASKQVTAQDAKVGGTWSSLTSHGEATNLNLAHMKNIDPTNVRDLTRAEIVGRKTVGVALKGLQDNLPGFENAKLRNLGMTLGVRDSRKIIAQYNLTADDVCNQGRFTDSIGMFPEFVDGYHILILPTTGRFFQVPYRSLVPINVRNLFVAGRCIGGDLISHAAVRNMMCCCVSGQGAGVAAAITAKRDSDSFNPPI